MQFLSPAQKACAICSIFRLIFPSFLDFFPYACYDMCKVPENGTGSVFSSGEDHPGKIYTIKDIARKAGVSVTTVSRVLNKRPDVNQATREKVERVLRRSIEYAFANPMASREWVKAHAQEMEDEVIDKHIALFVNDFTVSLGDEGRRAVERLTSVRVL